MVTIMGPATATPNEVVMLRLVIQSTQPGAGFNVSSTMGTLATTDGNARVSGGELTHRAPFMRGAMSSISIPFTWQAPNVTGMQSIRAAGNAVNLNGGSSGDGWNTATLAINVTSGGGTDAGLVPPDARPPTPDAGPMPADAAPPPPPVDAGPMPMMDAGAPPAPDSGAPPAPDAGAPPAPDAGAPPSPDAGAPIGSDASVSTDGGMMMSTGGCGCTTAPTRATPSAMGLALAALGAVIAGRRRR
jgi:MYXO-CTERM domain-containing protein